jgi:hypothetical protein
LDDSQKQAVQRERHIMRRILFAASALLILAITAAFAQEQSVVEPQSAAPPVVDPAQPVPAPQPMPAPATTEEPMPGPVTNEAAVHPTPPIRYHAGPRARRMLARHQQIELVMVVKNPADCCLYEIPLCVPACCEGEPAVREGRGLFGRGIVEYCWPCGFTAKVKFRPVLCDVKVDYSVN